jgi:tetratricopeptide (TPR) repeat protein
MRKLYPYLKWVWAVPISGWVLASPIRACFIGPFQGEGCQWRQGLDFMEAYGLWVVLTLLVLAGLTFFAWRDRRHHEAREDFALLKPADKLSPEDLDFKVVKSGEPVPQDQRPFYESIYVSRVAVPYHKRAEDNPQPRYNEAELVNYLEGGDGRGFVFLGPPLDGKSRTLYEIMRRMEGYKVVVPKPTEKAPADEAFSLLLEGERVVMLLDDLTRYVDAEVDLREFWERLRRHVNLGVVASTCRDGPELNAVWGASKQGLRWLHEERILLELSLLRASLEDKRRLIEGIGKSQQARDLELLPNVGQIAMEGTMRNMKVRFDRISNENPEQRDALRSLKLLSAAGLLPFTRERLLAAMQGIFECDPTHLGDCLDALVEQSFLKPGDHEPIEPEPAYLWSDDVVSYPPGMRSENYFPKLADMLEDREDTEGLFYLGSTYALVQGDYEEARACFDRAVRLRPGDPQFLLDKGKALFRLGRHLRASDASEKATEAFEEALSVYEEAINLKRSFPQAWGGKGMALLTLAKYQEAVDALNEAIDLEPDFHEAWCPKGLALVRLDRPEEALDAVDEAIRIRSDCLQSWITRGDALYALGSVTQGTEHSQESSEILEEALEALEEATNLQPDDFEAWWKKGRVLTSLERHQEALEAFDRATTLKPDDPRAWEEKGKPLLKLKRYEELAEVTAKALRLDPDSHNAWAYMGEAQYHLGRPWVEVAKYFDKAISLRPDEPRVWYNKAATAGNSGWNQEAVDTFDKALSLKPDYPEALEGRSIALASLERYQEALEDLNRAIGFRPDEPEYLERKANLLRKMGRYEEAREAFEEAANLRLDN